MQKDYNGFRQKARETGEQILGLENPLIVHHLDCDGITSGAIVAMAFKNAGKPYSMKMLKRVDNETIASLPQAENYVFVDIGSGQLDVLQHGLKNKKVFIIDHHPPNGDDNRITQINPHLFGFNGEVDACSATTAWYCFKHLNDWMQHEAGIVGAVGDIQDQQGMVGLNKGMLDDAVEKSLVLKTTDLKMYGRVSRPLISFLSFCTEPFLPGLTGNDKNCAIFLNENNIQTEKDGKTLKYYDLNVFDRKKLASALIAYAAEKIGEEATTQLVGDVYLFLKEPEDSELRDAYEFSTIMNACGRHDAVEAGVKTCMHEPEAIQQARAKVAEHRLLISKGISFAKEKVADLGPFYFIDARGHVSDTVIGTVAGSFYGSGTIKQDKPVLAFSLDEDQNIKVSSRGTKKLIGRGLHLGEVMRKASEAAGGLGGGHNIAAGGAFKPTKENVDAFLKKAREVIEVQLPKQ